MIKFGFDDKFMFQATANENERQRPECLEDGQNDLVKRRETL